MDPAEVDLPAEWVESLEFQVTFESSSGFFSLRELLEHSASAVDFVNLGKSCVT